MKRVISIFLAIIIVALSFDMGAYQIFAASDTTSVDIWGGLQKAQGNGSFIKGDGSAENPYIIENGDQLYKMVYDFGTIEGVLNNGTPAYYKLGCDIYLNDVSDYAAWGKDGFDMSTLNNWAEYQDVFCHRTFFGNFNGDGHTIYGLYAYGYRVASFFPNVSHGAVVRNVSFKNSYAVNTSGMNTNEQEDAGESTGQKVWYAGAFGSAGVIFGNAMSAGDSDYNTVDFTINNCSVIDAYVEAKYFTSAFVAAANSCQPYIANCMTSNITLNSTSETQGVEGAIINMPYGSTNPTATMENILAVGYPIYGAGRDEMWSGHKKPSMSHTYTFNNVYSTVSNTYTFNHSSYGSLSFTDSEVTVVDESKLIGAEAEVTIPAFDWAYTWRAVEGGYPIPMREYIVPTGDEYYQNGGPKYTTDEWDGTVAAHFAAGDGSLEDPYLIANCEEFYLMSTSPENDKYYKIADGVTDLYFNEVDGKSYSTLMLYFSFGIGKKYALSEDVCFSGSFDGNGVVFHGILASSENKAALFSQIGSATLKNFTVKYSYFKTSSTTGDGAAAIVGSIKENSVAFLKNIAVIDSEVTSSTNAAGLIGNVENESTVYVENCIVSGGDINSSGTPSYEGAFIANGTSCSPIIKNSISLGIYPASEAEASCQAKYVGVYTDTEAPSSVVADATSSINVVENSALNGDKVKLTCSEFDWQYSWTTTSSIPMPQNQVFNNGVVGEAWSGGIASAFAGGNGTESNPYQINTPEMLARMLVCGNAGEYYKLTADIYINNTDSNLWHKTAVRWYSSSEVVAFNGCLDGNGFTVHGLYCDIKSPNEYAALIPILGSNAKIKKLKIDNAYLSGQEGTYLGAVVGIVEDNATITASIDACVVENGVTFEGGADVGGIVAGVGFARLRIENCVFEGAINTSGEAYGISGKVIGALHIDGCISKDAYPFEICGTIDANNVYTNKGSSADGVYVLTNDKMIGSNADVNMSGLDFTTLWKIVENDLPEPTGNTKSYDGVKGEIWSGKTAFSFAGGDGTAGNPFLIETGEQLALAISTKYSNTVACFKLACDIYLNDVDGDMWESKVGCTNWLNSSKTGLFKGTFDGDGYVVYGMCYNYDSTPSNTYYGLIPRIGGSATIKNVGISDAYIKVSTEDTSVYAGGIFGMGSAFYDFYSNKNNPLDTVGDEFLVPGKTTPTKLPSITNCFVDHKSYIEAYGVGGIGTPGGAAVVVRDCYVTATLKGSADSRVGAIIGPNWANCSRVYNCIAFPQTDTKTIVGNHQWVETMAGICTYLENVYYYGLLHIFNTTRIKRPQWRIGEAAKENMPELDWESVWRTEEDGTPVLRIFDKEDRSAERFSDKSFNIPDVTISFETNAEGVTVEDITGKAYEAVDLPTPERQGYKFVAWHAFDDLSLEYPYDYFLARDLTLYAEWQEVSITQDFENYPFTEWDCDSDVWNYNNPNSSIGYQKDFVHSGSNSMQLMEGSGNVAEVLINYRQTLTAGQRYTISFWVATESKDTIPQLALAHKIYPDYLAADKLIEPITNQEATDGNWTQYTYTFTARTPWIAIKTLCGKSVYIDDIVIATEGELLEEAEITNDVVEGEYYRNILERVTLAKGVTTVAEFAFTQSDFLTDIFISDSITQIDKYAFYGCDRIENVWYSGTEEDFEKLIIADNNEPILDAVWHFNSCRIGTEHIYDDENDADCNLCGVCRNGISVGDVNGDSSIDNRDYALLMQYLNGWDVEIDETVADVNGDNAIDNRDYALLMQYLNGWDVELKTNY